MPIYEYECRKCGRSFETLVLGGGQAKVSCPGCGSIRIRRLMSSFGGKIGNSSGGTVCGSCSATRCPPT